MPFHWAGQRLGITTQLLKGGEESKELRVKKVSSNAGVVPGEHDKYWTCLFV
jgi:hypothetical protein